MLIRSQKHFVQNCMFNNSQTKSVLLFVSFYFWIVFRKLWIADGRAISENNAYLMNPSKNIAKQSVFIKSHPKNSCLWFCFWLLLFFGDYAAIWNSQCRNKAKKNTQKVKAKTMCLANAIKNTMCLFVIAFYGFSNHPQITRPPEIHSFRKAQQ